MQYGRSNIVMAYNIIKHLLWYILCTRWGDFNLEKRLSDVTRFHKIFIGIYYNI